MMPWQATQYKARPGVSPNPIEFGGENKIGFGQSIYFMGPDAGRCPAPTQFEIGVMTLLLANQSGTVDKGQCLGKILKRPFLFQMVSTRYAPTIKL